MVLIINFFLILKPLSMFWALLSTILHVAAVFDFCHLKIFYFIFLKENH